MKDIGKMIKQMEKVQPYFKMDKDMRGILKMDFITVLECYTTQMELFMKVNGISLSIMEKASYYMKMETFMKVILRTTKDKVMEF